MGLTLPISLADENIDARQLQCGAYHVWEMLGLADTGIVWHLQEILSSLKVSLGTSKTKFSAALSKSGNISVEGVVKGGKAAFITKVGQYDVDLSVEGIVILARQTDKPGIIAGQQMVSPTRSLSCCELCFNSSHHMIQHTVNQSR